MLFLIKIPTLWVSLAVNIVLSSKYLRAECSAFDQDALEDLYDASDLLRQHQTSRQGNAKINYVRTSNGSTKSERGSFDLRESDNSVGSMIDKDGHINDLDIIDAITRQTDATIRISPTVDDAQGYLIPRQDSDNGQVDLDIPIISSSMSELISNYLNYISGHANSYQMNTRNVIDAHTGSQTDIEDLMVSSVDKELNEVLNKTQIVDDQPTLTSFCDPPNPCPIGYSAEFDCLEGFINSVRYNQFYQASQGCAIDLNHRRVTRYIPGEGQLGKTLDDLEFNSDSDHDLLDYLIELVVSGWALIVLD